MSRSRRIKCELCNVRSEKTRQVHGYEKQNRQEAWRLQVPVAFLSFSFYDLMQFLSKSVKVASSWQFPWAQWLSCKLGAQSRGSDILRMWITIFRCFYILYIYIYVCVWQLCTLFNNSFWFPTRALRRRCAMWPGCASTHCCRNFLVPGTLGFIEVQPQGHGRLKVISTSLV